jgi:hypothetical protein
VLLAVGSWYGLRAQPPTTGPAPEAAPPNPFAGKALMLTVKSDPDWITCIENPSVQHVGGKDFVVGTCFQGGDDDEWRAGLTIWTAMDDISQITEARDVETLKKKMQDTAEEDSKPTRA